MSGVDPQLVARFREAMARRYSENAADAIALSGHQSEADISAKPAESELSSESVTPTAQNPTALAKGKDLDAKSGYRILVCADPDDRAMVIVDWILLAMASRGICASATPLPIRRGRTSGAVIDVGAPTCDGPAYDVIIAAEHAHLAKALPGGASDPSRTTIIASSSRIFSASERDAPRHEVVSEREIDGLAAASSRRYLCFDAGETAAWFSLPRSARPALLFGAAVVESLPGIDADSARAAVRRLGIDVSGALRAIKVGSRYGRRVGGRPARTVDGQRFARRARRRIVRARRDRVDELAESAHKLLPLFAPDVRAAAVQVLEHGDPAAATRLIELCLQLHEIEIRRGIDDSFGSSVPQLAAGLARIMCYHDPAWDATIRLRPNRMGEVRARHQIPRNSQQVVTDMMAWTESEYASVSHRGDSSESSWLAEAVKTSAVDPGTIGGIARLSRLRRSGLSRAQSARHATELAAAEEYASAVCAAVQVDPSLGARVARTAALVQGSGVLRVGSRQLAVGLWGRVISQSLGIDRLAGDSSFGFARAVIPFALDQVAREGLLGVWELAGQVVGIGMHASRGGTREEVLLFADLLCRPRPIARCALDDLGGAPVDVGAATDRSDAAEVVGAAGVDMAPERVAAAPFSRMPLQLSDGGIEQVSLAESLDADHELAAVDAQPASLDHDT